jgi:tRNA threonylcarbamoyl adenosine modification protein YeaZ
LSLIWHLVLIFEISTMFLLIDTSQPEAWVALGKEEKIMAERRWGNDRHIGPKLLIAIEELLKKYQLTLTDLERIAVYPGPGHYGAIRVGVTTANLLALDRSIPLATLNSHEPLTALREARTNIPVFLVKPVYI